MIPGLSSATDGSGRAAATAPDPLDTGAAYPTCEMTLPVHRLRAPLLATLIAPLALLLGAGAARAQEGTPWGWAEGRTVQSVLWQGLEELNPSEALHLINTRPGEAFSAHTLSLDIARLYRSGRFAPPAEGIPPVAVDVRPVADDGVVIEFTVHERPRVRKVVFEGEIPLDRDEIERRVQTRDGALFDRFTAERDARALRQALVAKGYLMAEVAFREEPRETGTDVFFTVRAGPKVHVDRIIYHGADQLDLKVLAQAQGPDALETKERALFGLLEEGIYDPEAFQRDLERIARYYRSQGFLDVRVYKLEERTSLDGEKLTLVVGIEEGPRYTVRRVLIEGTRVIDGDRLREALPLRPGRPFLGDDLRRAIERIRHLYGQRAHVHASVDVDVRYDLERHMLDIVLQVDEGPKVRIDQIRIEGNTKTREDVIRRELSFFPGEYFDADAVQDSIGRLGRLRFFNDVRIDFDEGTEPGREDIVLSVDEARTGSFVLGGGVSTATGFFGNISLTQRNFDITDVPTSWREFLEGRAFTGAGQNLTISLQPGRERSQYSIEFTEPYLLGYPIPLTLQAATRDRQREDWLESRRSGRVGLGYRLTQDLIFRTVYRLERVHVGDIRLGAVPDVLDVAGTNYLSGVRLSLTYNQNLIDQDFVVYGGYAGTVYYEHVGQFLGGDHSFMRAGVEANWQHSFFAWPNHHKWVLALRGELGWQRGIGGDIPIFERFFAGGPNSIRGFRFRSVGPSVNRDPIGGNMLTLGSAEFSYPIFQDLLRGVFFADAGTVTPGIGDIGFGDIRIAAGFGLRIKVPFFPAPVALDFAWPLKSRRGDQEQVFSFSVGFGF